jgi:hypothetical protein
MKEMKEMKENERKRKKTKENERKRKSSFVPEFLHSAKPSEAHRYQS